jgi:hypothetical protein
MYMNRALVFPISFPITRTSSHVRSSACRTIDSLAQSEDSKQPLILSAAFAHPLDPLKQIAVHFPPSNPSQGQTLK